MGAYKSADDAEGTAKILRAQGARATVETRLVTEWEPTGSWPTQKTVEAMLHQLEADREQSTYWRDRWAKDGTDHAIEAWLGSLLDAVTA